METQKINEIKFSRNWYRAIKAAPTKEEQHAIIFAVLDYAFDGEDAIKDAPNIAKAVVAIVKSDIDRQKARILANSRNGKKGGAPIGNQYARKFKKGE